MIFGNVKSVLFLICRPYWIPLSLVEVLRIFLDNIAFCYISPCETQFTTTWSCNIEDWHLT